MAKKKGRQHRNAEPQPRVVPIARTEPRPLDYTAPVEFGRRLEASFGNEFLTLLRDLISRLSEYDQMVTEEVFSLDEMLDYLGGTDYFADIAGDVQQLADAMNKHRAQTVERFVAQDRSPQSIMQLMESNALGLQVAIRSDMRPIIKLLLDNVAHASYDVPLDMAEYLLHAGGQKIPDHVRSLIERSPFGLEEMVFSQASQAVTRVLPRADAAKKVQPLYDFISSVRAARQWQRHPEQHGSIDAADDEARADAAAEQLRQIAFEPTIVDEKRMPVVLDIHSPLPWILKAEFIVLEGDRTLTSAFIHLHTALDKKDNPQRIIFGLSGITGGLLQNGSTIITPRVAFHRLNADALFEHIRRVLLEGVVDAIGEGVIRLSEDENGDEDVVSVSLEVIDAGSVLETMSEGAADDTLPVLTPSDGPAVIERPATPVEQPATTEAQPSQLLSPVAPAEPKPQQARLPRILDYERAVRALESSGVVFSRSGKHPKMSFEKDGRRVSLPFFNKHSNTNEAMVRHCVRRALHMVGISVEDFMRAY